MAKRYEVMHSAIGGAPNADGVYSQGDLLEAEALGGELPRLLEVGAVREIDVAEEQAADEAVPAPEGSPRRGPGRPRRETGTEATESGESGPPVVDASNPEA